jgi:hypothetical protein
MIKTINLTTNVPPNHEIRLTLPADVPTGPTDIVVMIASRSDTAAPTLGEFLQSEFFGMWRDRTDIADSAEFARQLRIQAWSRSA